MVEVLIAECYYGDAELGTQTKNYSNLFGLIKVFPITLSKIDMLKGISKWLYSKPQTHTQKDKVNHLAGFIIFWFRRANIYSPKMKHTEWTSSLLSLQSINVFVARHCGTYLQSQHLLGRVNHQYPPAMNHVSYSNGLHCKLQPSVKQLHEYQSNQPLFFIFGFKKYSMLLNPDL